MAKTIPSSPITLSPWRISQGNGIYLEDVKSVIEAANYTYAHLTNSHLSIVTGQDGWGSTGNEAATHNVTFPGTTTTTTYYQTHTWIDSDVVDLYLEAFVNIGTGASCAVNFAIGSGSSSLSFSSAGAANANTTIATSSTGTGWQLLKITLTTSTVGSATSELLELRVEDVAQTTAASIRDPSQ